MNSIGQQIVSVIKAIGTSAGVGLLKFSVVPTVIVVLDKGLVLSLEVTRQIVVPLQGPVLQGLMPPFDRTHPVRTAVS